MSIRGDKQGGTNALGDRLLGVFGQIVTKWSAYGVVASSLVYALGYLSMRFKLTALGLVTDLDVLDERYLFEGFKFLIFVASSVPIVVLIALPIAGLLWLLQRLRPGSWTAVHAWWRRRTGPLVASICISVLTIQLVMRQCFRFDNLLLRPEWPGPAWFGTLLTSGHDLATQSFFAALLAGTALPAAGLFACAEWGRANRGQRALSGVLAFLVVVQMILLPVNYGVLTSGRGLARLAALPDAAPPESRGWLVWEAKDITLLLVRDGEAPRLVTFARDKAPAIQVSGYDFPDDVRRGFAAPPNGPDGPSTRSTRRAQSPSGWALLASALGLDASAANVRAPETADSQAKVRGILLRIPAKAGGEPVRLRSRHWVITDGRGRIEEVRGRGVVGEQPLLDPGESFQYTSGCVLETPQGTMHGTYRMQRDDGTYFEAEISPFVLQTPTAQARRVLN